MSAAPLPGQRMNVVDKVVSFFNPTAGIMRMAARTRLHEFSYNPRPHERGDSGGQVGNANSESYKNQRDRFRMMWDARDLVAFEWIGGTLARLVTYVVGQLTCKSATGDDTVDAVYDQFFYNWCGDLDDDDGLTQCDVTGRHRLIKMVQQALLAMFVDGDAGFVLVSDSQTVQLQAIEADCIGSPVEALQSEKYIGGVTIDDRGRVQSYRVFQRTRNGQYVKPEEIAPMDFIHLSDPQRSDQYRGVSYLRGVLEDVRDIREWIQAEKIAGKTQSMFAGMVGSADPSARSGASDWNGTLKDGTKTQDATWGKILRMAEGERFSFLAPSARPSGAFMSFVQTVFRKMAVTLDVPFGMIWDLATLGGVTARIEVQQAQRKINYWQKLLVDKVLRRVRTRVIADGIAFHGLPANPNWKKCEWHFGPWITTDAGYETSNDATLLGLGIVSAPDVAAKYNGDLRDVARANAGAINNLQQLSAETGVPIELLAPQWLSNASPLLASMNTPPPPPPEPGTQEAVGDKGMSQIIDILTKAGKGEITKESAVSTLVSMYGVPQAQAEAIVPEPMEPKSEEGAIND